MRLPRLPFLLLLLACAPALLGAQRAGIVQDSTGVPVSGALVEALIGTRRIAAATTDSAGAWRLTGDSLRAASTLLVRRLGFRPITTAWRETGVPAVITMARLAESLPEVTVTAAAAQCPQRDDPAARDLWQRVAGRYVHGEGWRYATRLVVRHATVRAAEIERLARGDARVGGAAAPVSERVEQAIEIVGSAWRLRGAHPYEGFGVWQYPPLEGALAWQFTDSTFAARHSLRVVRRDGEGTVLSVCPADPRAAGLEGELTIAPDSSAFLGARWRIRGGAKGSQPTGGEVTFVPEEGPGGAPLLLPSAGVYWRRLSSGSYWVRWTDYDSWVVRSDTAARADSVGVTRH